MSADSNNVFQKVNSVAHIWGSRPYDKGISPTETYLVGIAALGEGKNSN